MRDTTPAAGSDPDSVMAALKAQLAAAKASGDEPEVTRLTEELKVERGKAGRAEAAVTRRSAMAAEVGGDEDEARKTPPSGRVTTTAGKSTTVATGKRG